METSATTNQLDSASNNKEPHDGWKKWKTIILKLSQNKWLVFASLIVLLFLLFFLNLMHLYQGKYSWSHILIVLANPTKDAIDFVGFEPGEAQKLSEGIWAIIATMIGVSGMVLAGLITQSLTQNPLADSSTLGMTQAAIFGLIVALSFGFVAYYIKFLFALIFGLAASLLLLLIVSFSKSKASIYKVVLAGLAIGIIFKTLTFLVRSGDKFLNAVSFSYVLGGAESVNRAIGNNQWTILYISSILIAVSLVIYVFIAKGMTLLELGDEKAKNLGVKTKITKSLSLIILILCIPSAVLLVGNLSFIGLFSVHASRYFMKSRDYRVILIPSLFFGIIMGLLGLYLSVWVPKVNSGLWMTFIGAPYLIYAGMRGLR